MIYTDNCRNNIKKQSLKIKILKGKRNKKNNNLIPLIALCKLLSKNEKYRAIQQIIEKLIRINTDHAYKIK